MKEECIMANSKQNYRTFSWDYQLIDEKMIRSVMVRIFRPLPEVIATNYLQLVDTDGKTIQKSSRSLKKHISDYSYVILSTGLFEKTHLHSENSFILFIKLYMTSDFDISKIQNVKFPGKSYLLDAYQQLQNTDLSLTPASKSEPDMIKYFKKKVGAEYENFYSLLQESVQTEDFNLTDRLFKNNGISNKYQALFWKELYLKEKRK